MVNTEPQTSSETAKKAIQPDAFLGLQIGRFKKKGIPSD